MGPNFIQVVLREQRLKGKAFLREGFLRTRETIDHTEHRVDHGAGATQFSARRNYLTT